MSDKKGIFGFFKGWSSVAEVEEQQRSHAISQDGNTVQVDDEESLITEEIELFVVEKLEEILSLSGFSGKVNLKQKRGFTLHLEIFDAGDDLGRIIGKNGHTLQALQLLVKFFAIRKFNVSIHVVLDAGDYKRRRQSQVKQIALRAGDDVLSSGESVALEPMSSSDRRMVHVLFEDHHELTTLSEGSGSYRHVVIVKRDDNDA